MGITCSQPKNTPLKLDISFDTTDCLNEPLFVQSPLQYNFETKNICSNRYISFQDQTRCNSNQVASNEIKQSRVKSSSEYSEQSQEVESVDIGEIIVQKEVYSEEESFNPSRKKILLNSNWFVNQKNRKSQPFKQKQVDEGIQMDLLDYSQNIHEPSKSYALKVNNDFEIAFKLSSNIICLQLLGVDAQQTLSKLSALKIVPQDNQQLLPHIEQPYYIFAKKAIYFGRWKFGVPQGCGIMYLESGEVLEGEFDNMEIHGEGRTIFNDGSYYEGHFFRGKCDGFGQLKRKDGFKFSGDWSNGKPHGKDSEYWPNGTKEYVGIYKNGLKHGKGEQIWANKDGYPRDTYSGDFFEGKLQGFGIYKWNDGRTYEGKKNVQIICRGEWFEGKMHGKGVFKWKNGRKYQGEYQHDLKQGQGIFTWPENIEIQNELKETAVIPLKEWKGNWEKGVMNGSGELWYKGICYKGRWVDGNFKKLEIWFLDILEKGNKNSNKYLKQLQIIVRIYNLISAKPQSGRELNFEQLDSFFHLFFLKFNSQSLLASNAGFHFFLNLLVFNFLTNLFLKFSVKPIFNLTFLQFKFAY